MARWKINMAIKNVKRNSKRRLGNFKPVKVSEEARENLVKASFMYPVVPTSLNPWIDFEVDTMESMDTDEYREVVDACRFFYKRDPLASSAVNKLVEIGINAFQFTKNGISDNELKIFTGIQKQLIDFSRCMGLEYLVSGLVIPEVSYIVYSKDKIKKLGIKMYETLTLPSSMWIRDSKLVKIKASFLDTPSYFVEIPKDLIFFIMNNGMYQDGTKDLELWRKLQVEYPEFVRIVKSGATEVLLKNDLIFRGKYLPDSPYPVPYLYSSLEALKHKRNLRRMDYSIASRVISAIMLVKLGSDEFPVTEDEEDVFDDIRQQMTWRYNGTGEDVERIFQLFGNHTLDISWIMPDVTALLDDKKYANVNKDILHGLGIPNILISGETERSAAGGASEFSMLSPESTMEAMRDKIINVIQEIIIEISIQNNLKSYPIIKFKPINLKEYNVFRQVLADLYSTGNISRETYDEIFGFSWIDEMDKKEEENKILKEKKLEEFAPKPFSPLPNTPGSGGGANPKINQNTQKNE